MSNTVIALTAWGAATFADSLFVLVTITPKEGYEPFYDWKDYTILKDDLSEVRRNREDTQCAIFLESGLTHTIPFNSGDLNNHIIVTVGGVTATSNEHLRDLIMSIVEPKYTT